MEETEVAKDARVAREIEQALPCELNEEQQEELVRKYVQETFVSLGMCADWSLHNPPVRDDLKRPINKNGLPTSDVSEMIFRNPHAHIMLTIRGINEKGNWEPKTQVEYLCVNSDGKEKALTAAELKEKISELSRTEDALKEQYREVKFSMEASDDTDDDRYYSDNSYDDYVECIVDDIVGMTGMLMRAFDDKRKKKRR